MKLKESSQFIPLRNGMTRAQSKAPLEVGWQHKSTLTWDKTGTFPNVGLRLDNLVAIDFDDVTNEQQEIIIHEALKYKSIIHLTGDKANEAEPYPKKGVQLLFKLPTKESDLKFKGNNLPLLFGLSADIKATNKGQVVIKLSNYEGDRTENSWLINESRDFSLYDLDELPTIFQPLTKQQPPENKLVWSEGVRNQTWMLFTRFLTKGFEKITEEDTLKYCNNVQTRLHIINDDYKKIVPDWFKKAIALGRFEGEDRLFWRTEVGTLIPYRLVDSIINFLKIKRYNEKLYVKNENNVYITQSNNGTLRTSLYDIDTKLTAIEVESVVKKLQYYAPVGELHYNWKYNVYTPTKVIDVKKNEMRDIGEDEFYLHSFKYEYKINAYDEGVDKFLDQISSNNEDNLIGEVKNRPAVKIDIIQALAVGIVPESFRKLFMFHGSGNNGKGTLFKMFRSLFASESTSAVALEKLIDDQFMTHMMKDVLVNVSDELSVQYFKEFGIIKSLISNDEIHGRVMHGIGGSFVPHVTLYLQGNMIPSTKEKTDAINNRLVFIPMNFKAAAGGSIGAFAQKYLTQSAQEYLFRLLIDRLRYNIMIDKLEYSKESEYAHRNFTSANDPMHDWINKQGIDYFIDQSRHTGKMFDDYVVGGDGSITTQRHLTSKIKTHFNLKSKINGWVDPTDKKIKRTTLVVNTY